MNRVLNHLKSNVIAYLALFVALGGTSYAAVSLPANSVGSRQLKNHSVSAKKLDRGSIAGYVRDWAVVADGSVLASRPRARIVEWTDAGSFPGGIVSWGKRIPKGCFALATSNAGSPTPAASVGAGITGGAFGAGVQIVTSAPMTAVDVAVICPAP
jgi:hypothetical protein